MHSISNGWKTNQNKQLRKKTDIKAYLFSGAKPVSVGGGGTVRCLEAMAFTLKGSETITFAFASPINIVFDGLMDANKVGVKFDVSLKNAIITNKYSTGIDLYNGSTVIAQNINLGTLFLSTTTYQNVDKIVFKIIGNGSGQIPSTICKWFSTNQPLELNSGDIETLTYRGHANILNENLPYHKLTLRTINKPISLRTFCAYFTIGYKGINGGSDEYIPLGCGYYYLDTASYDEFKQQYTFKDTIADLTMPYIYKSAGTLTLKQYVSHSLQSSSNKLYPIEKPNYSVAGLSNETSDYIPINDTVAEVLQMIGQNDCKTLYVNEYNTITFRDFRSASPTTDDNPVWILEKPVISQRDKAKKLQMTSYGWKTRYLNDTHTLETFASFTATQTGTVCMRFDKAYQSIQYNSTAVSVNNYNYIEFDVFNGGSYDVKALKEYYESAVESQTKIINQYGDTDYTLDLHLIFAPNLTSIYTYYLEWLAECYDLNLQVRLDPKYALGDKLTISGYGTFIIEDIEATYNGGYSGTLKGRIVAPYIKAPILKSKTTTSSTNYSFEVYNPNADYSLDLIIEYNGGTQYVSKSISPLETLYLNYSNTPELSTDVDLYENYQLGDDVSCHLEYENDFGAVYDSDSTVLLKANSPQAPILSNLNIVSNTEYSFKITNPNDLQMDLRFGWSGDHEDIIITMQPNETITLNHDNFPHISADIYYWLLRDLHDDVYCWLEETFYQIDTDTAIILEANNGQDAILSNLNVPDYDTYSFDIDNPYDFAVVLKFWYEDDYLANTFTIPANTTLHLDQNNLGSDWVGLIADYIDDELYPQVDANLFDSNNNVRNVEVVLEES